MLTTHMKVANIISSVGAGPDGGPEVALNVPKECAVKVFKTTLNEFKTRDKYIREDYRWEFDNKSGTVLSVLS